jgi:hypothetical protein
MRLREIDAGGWVRLLGLGLLAAGLWTLLAVRDFALTPVVVVLVAAAVLVVVVVVVIAIWASAGGYRRQRRLQAWVRGSDAPAEVPVPVRIRHLRRITERGAWVGWFSIGLAGLNVVNGVITILGGDDPWSSVFSSPRRGHRVRPHAPRRRAHARASGSERTSAGARMQH